METTSQPLGLRAISRPDVAWVGFFVLVTLGWIALIRAASAQATQHQVGLRATSQ